MTTDVATMDVELIDIGFGECVRSSNEEFRTVEWEVISGVIPEQSEQPTDLGLRRSQA